MSFTVRYRGNIRKESFMATNLDGYPQDFADVIRARQDICVGKTAVERGDDADFTERPRRGFREHIFAALCPEGHAGRPIWVASGRKPQ